MIGHLHPLLKNISDSREKLTPKGNILAEYIIKYPRKVVFMTARGLAESCRVSEATVVRFVSQIGFATYSEFQQSLRDFVDTELTLLERLDLTDLQVPGGELFRRVVFEEIENLKQLYETLDIAVLDRVIQLLQKSSNVFVIGSRLSYMFAYYMGWSLTKIRPNIHILKGSDSTTFDWLTIAPPESLVVIIATSRYPNELIRIGKFASRIGRKLVVIADSATCPLSQFADENLTAPSRYIPFIGSPTALSCLINYISHELASRMEEAVKHHQEGLEKTYLENDIFFNLKK